MGRNLCNKLGAMLCPKLWITAEDEPQAGKCHAKQVYVRMD